MINQAFADVVKDAALKVDVAIGGGAITSWWWLQHFDHSVHVLLAVGGLILLGIRILSAWKDYKKKRGK